MRIACWRSLAIGLIVTACSHTPNAWPPAVSVVGAFTENGRTRIELQVRSARQRLQLARDDTVPRDAQPRDLRTIAEVPGASLAVVMTFPSVPGGLSLCQAGEEQFLYVISLSNEPHTTYQMKLASCRTNLELAERGLEWDSARSVLHIRWLIGPSGASEQRSLAIGPGGEISVISE